jgi:ABC-type nitrate/sulfonate/bicarbonate transport system permease component
MTNSQREKEAGIIHRFLGSRLSGVVLLLIVLVSWDLSARYKVIDLISWPPFFDVALHWFVLIFSGVIPMELLTSLRRLLIGYGLAIGLGVPLGLLIGFYRPAYNLFEPVVEALRPISVIALIPVIILFLGLEDPMKIFIVFYGCFFPILLNTISGVRDIDPTLIGTSRTFGLSKAQSMFKVVLPAAGPSIFTGLRISLGFSLVAVVAAEMLSGGNGIGAFILDSQRTFKVREMYAGIITLGLVGYLINRAFLSIERRALGWQI